MDQSAIYSETLRERIVQAYGRVGDTACGHVGCGRRACGNRTERLKTGARTPGEQPYPGRAEFFALPFDTRNRLWPLTLLITDY